MDSADDSLASLARQHLLLRLGPINRALERLVTRQSETAARIPRPDLNALCVTDDQVRFLLDEIDHGDAAPADAAEGLNADEAAREGDLRARAVGRLPLDILANTLALTPFELDAILTCAAVEIDRRYERVMAFILDDLDRRRPCVELLCDLSAANSETVLARRAAIGRFGRLRRAGLLIPVGHAESERRQELRIAPALLHWLIDAEGDPASFVDPAEVHVDAGSPVPPAVDGTVFAHLVQAMCCGDVSIVAILGRRPVGHAACARALAAGVGRRLRRVPTDSATSLGDELAAASAVGAIAWLDVDALTEPGSEALQHAIAARLAVSRTPVVLTGTHPWKPIELLAARPYSELNIDEPDSLARTTMWADALPEVAAAKRDDLALRFRMSEPEMLAVAQVARATAHVRGNGVPLPLDGVVDEACLTVARRRSDHFATVTRPQRRPEDLVLPPDLHRQVTEIPRFFRSLPRVAETWRIGRNHTGRSGLKVLLAGESGTGKTLAAEVVASDLALPLLKIDLSRVTSKWVGDTEKSLDLAFCEAEDSHAILFFDEADALFSKRGSISRGTDRWANLSVSFLLQRVDDHPGLVILATNLGDSIDEAFVRRFHVILHFQRPNIEDRARLWKLALPSDAPLDADVDVAALARLDLTGAGIVGTARTAALLAADEGAQAIGMVHLVRAARRQFQREARLLTNTDLGRYADLLSVP